MRSLLNSNMKTTYSTYLQGNVYAFKTGNQVTIILRGTMGNMPTGTTTDIFTLSSDYRPKQVTVYGMCAFGGNNNKFGLFQIDVSGLCKIFNYSGSAATYAYGSISYPI